MSRWVRKFFVCTICTAVLFISMVSVTVLGKGQGIDSQKVDKFVKSEMEAGHIPGVSVGIVKNGEVLYLKGFGVADNNRRAITPDTPFGLGSISKTFTALAIRQLADEGKIDTNKYVKEYIPWFKTADSINSDKIRIVDLINHRSGFSTQEGTQGYLYDTRYSLEDLIKLLRNVKLVRKPGTLEEYSNIDYLVLGLIIEKVTNMSYGDYIQNKIFNPLDMKNSYTSQEDAVNNGMSKGYGIRFGFAASYNPKYPSGHTPAGFLISSARDMAKYMEAYLSNGYYDGKSIIPNNNLAELKVNERFNYNYYGIYWTHEVGMPEEYRNSYCHVGAWVNNHVTMMIMPVEKIGIIVLTNIRNDYYGPAKNSTTITNGIADILSGVNPPAYSDLGFSKRYIALNVLGTLIIILLLWHVFRTKGFVKRINHGKGALTRNILSLCIIDFILPLLAIAYYLITSTSSSLQLNLISIKYGLKELVSGFSTDYPYILILATVILILCGVVKIIMLIRENTRSKSSGNTIMN